MELRQIEKTGTNEVKLTIAVTAEEFGRAVDAAIREKGKTLTVHGFRKGKAPKALIEKTYGREFFYQDAVNETYGVAYDMAVAEAKIVPVDRAEIALVDCSEEGYTLTATVTVKPEVTVKNYKGIKAEKLVTEVSESQVDGELANMLERNARIVEVEDRPAQNGDQAEIDYEGFKDGVPFEGGKGEHFPLELGSGQFIPGFEDQVCGHNAGDEFDVNVSFPEDYPAEELKGAPVVFKCKLHSIKAKDMPVADDEFAKDVSEFDTIEELKADIKAKLQEKADAASEAELEEKLVDAILENMEAEIPECMYEARMEDIAADFENRLARTAGLTLDEYIKYTGADKETFFAGFKPQAERQVKIRLALEEIAKLEKLEMTEEEMNEEFKKLAERYEMKEEQVRKIVPADELALDLCVEKAIKLVRDAAKITEVSAADAAKEEAPKKKRTTKKKTEEAPVEEGEEAPKKKRTTKKKVEEEPAVEGEEAPKKKATRKKKTEEIDPSID